MDLKRLWKKLGERGGVHETPDPTPVAAPFKFDRPKSLAEMVREAVQGHALAAAAAREGYDTFEEWDDYEPEDDNDLSTEHELVHDPDLDREVTKYEKRHLDADRARFDEFVKHKQAEARKAKKEAKKVKEDPDKGS